MKEEKLVPDSIEEELDYSGRPFDFRDMDDNTSMICEDDPEISKRIAEDLRALNFRVVEAGTYKEALKYSNFHTFNAIVVNENFDIGKDGVNHVLEYLNSLPMFVRRQIFVVLISSTFETMDYMNTLNKSVNLIINKSEISGPPMGMVLKKEMEENEYFYHVFKDFQIKLGKA